MAYIYLNLKIINLKIKLKMTGGEQDERLQGAGKPGRCSSRQSG